MIKKEWKELTGITNTLAHDLSLDEKINIEDMTCNELKILYKHDNGLLYNNAFFNDNTNIGYVNPKKITKSILTANNFGGKTSKCRVNFYYNMILKNNILDGDWDIKDIINTPSISYKNKEVIALEKSIKEIGYKSQKELGKSKSNSEVVIAIGRNGELLHVDGIHRLRVAIKYNIERIPVIIVLRHKNWIPIKDDIIKNIHNLKRSILYQPITHPEFSEFKSAYDHYRYDVIKKNLTLKKGTLLDIGSCYGYFCNRFEESGFNCTAVENNSTFAYMINKLKNINQNTFNIIDQSLFSMKEKKFDIVLGLNVYQHFMKGKSKMKQFINYIKTLKVKEHFIQVPEYLKIEDSDDIMSLDFITMIIKYGNLKNMIELPSKSRKMYKLF